MSSLFIRNKHNNKRIILLYVFSFVLVVVILFSIPKMRSGVLYLSTYFNNYNVNEIEIGNLKNKINDLEIENKYLKESNIGNINFDSSSSYKIANVIFSENVFYNSLIIKTNSENILEGDIVYLSGGYPIGVIDKILADTVEVKLFSYKDFAFTLLLQDVDNSFYDVGAIGDGMYGVYAYLDRDKNVSVGQKVYYKNNTNKEIGEIIKIEDKEKENLKKVFIKTYYKDHQDEFVFVKK